MSVYRTIGPLVIYKWSISHYHTSYKFPMLNSHRPGGENLYYQSPCDNFDYYMHIQYSHMCIQYARTVRFSKRFYLKEGTFKTHNFNRSLIKLSKTNI